VPSSGAALALTSSSSFASSTSAAPSTDGAVADGAVPDAAVPDAAVPDAAPDGALCDGATCDGSTPTPQDTCFDRFPGPNLADAGSCESTTTGDAGTGATDGCYPSCVNALIVGCGIGSDTACEIREDDVIDACWPETGVHVLQDFHREDTLRTTVSRVYRAAGTLCYVVEATTDTISDARTYTWHDGCGNLVATAINDANSDTPQVLYATCAAGGAAGEFTRCTGFELGAPDATDCTY
jgi:hypothetical protein